MSKNRCVFCDIVNGIDSKTEILFQNELLVIFKDIKPAATHHYLVVSKEHIQNPKQLNGSHKEIVQQMVQAGNDFLSSKEGKVDDRILGFHWPPFNLIDHLHLHVISPVGEMGFIKRNIYRPNSLWFVTADWLVNWLNKM